MRNAYLLARAFGWTPRQVQEMTMAQAQTYLTLLEAEGTVHHGG